MAVPVPMVLTSPGVLGVSMLLQNPRDAGSLEVGSGPGMNAKSKRRFDTIDLYSSLTENKVRAPSCV